LAFIGIGLCPKKVSRVTAKIGPGEWGEGNKTLMGKHAERFRLPKDRKPSKGELGFVPDGGEDK